MNLLRSLTNRIFLASSLLAVMAVATAILVVNIQVTARAEAELRHGLAEAGTLVDQYRSVLLDSLVRQTRMVADLPRFKATVALDDPPTMALTAEEYRSQMAADVLLVTNPAGRVLADAGGSGFSPASIPALPAIRSAVDGKEHTSFWRRQGAILQGITVPVWIGDVEHAEILGTLTVAFKLDRALAEQLKELTDSEVVFAMDGQVPASTLDGVQPVASSLLKITDVTTTTIGGEEYVALSRPLGTRRVEDTRIHPVPELPVGGNAATVIVLRSRTEHLRFLRALHTALGATAVVAVVGAVILSYAVARTITRPLAAITATMRDMAATGDLTRKVPLRHDAGWNDEDAILLATTFNAMTESIARFQREAAQRERLSSLGRLAMVIAHEVRNPLMIIKTALRTLRKHAADPDGVHAAAGDIDEEVARLNHIVAEVLDFARPIRLDYEPADLNGVCADAAHAISANGVTAAVSLDLDPRVGTIVTDAERLRLVLVNVLENARQAVVEADATAAHAGAAAAPAVALPQNVESQTEPAIRLRTQALPGSRVLIIVDDRGRGIAAEDVSRIFEPYFTTKRTGTGLGLAISKNIVEALGGTISVNSRQGFGTEMTIELPCEPVTASKQKDSAQIRTA